MRKLGIRLIGVLFLIWAILNLFGLITGTSSTKGFLGFDLGITYNGKPINVMSWIGVYILGYIGYHLLRLNMQGRTWALIVLWFSVIGSGLLLIFSLIMSAGFLISNTPSDMTFHIFNRAIKLESPINLPLATSAIFLFYAIQLCFLMNKDVKMEFQRQETLEAKPQSG